MLSSKLQRNLFKKRPAAEKAISASTLVAGMVFNAAKILCRLGGNLPVASKEQNSLLISFKTSAEDLKEPLVDDLVLEVRKALSSSLFDFPWRSDLPIGG